MSMWLASCQSACVDDPNAVVTITKLYANIRLTNGEYSDKSRDFCDFAEYFAIRFDRDAAEPEHPDSHIFVNARRCTGMGGYSLPQPLVLERTRDADCRVVCIKELDFFGNVSGDLRFDLGLSGVVLTYDGGGGPRLRPFLQPAQHSRYA